MRTSNLIGPVRTALLGTVAIFGLTGTALAQELTVQTQNGEASVKLFNWLAEEFEAANPGVTVTLQTITQEQKIGSNLAVLGSGNPPDVGMIPINSQVYTQLTANDALEPISDVWESANLGERYSPQVVSSLQVDGVPYTVAYTQVMYNLVWYNPEIFEEVGIEVPADRRIKTNDELIAMAAALRDAGYGPLQIGGGSGYHASWMIDTLLPTAATADEMDNYLKSYNSAVPVTVAYTDEPFVKVLETLKLWSDSNVFQDGFLGQQAPDATAPFLAGRAGMAIGGSFSVAEFSNGTMEFEPDWLLLPPVNADATSVQTLYFGDAIGIPAGARNKDLAKKFLEFVISDDVQRRGLIDYVGILPAVNSLPADALAALPKSTQELLQDIAEYGGAPGWAATVPGGVAQANIDPLVQQLYAGDKGVEQVAQEQQARLEEFRAEGE